MKHSGNINVAVMGDFARGKSLLINALLGQDILPVNVLPCTAVPIKVAYGVTPSAEIEYKDGRTEEIAIDKLKDYVTNLTDASRETVKNIKEATVFYPADCCKNGITIIDTPGLNNYADTTAATMSALPQADAVIMAMMAIAPFSESERDFIENALVTRDLDSVIFVANGVELLEAEDVESVLAFITKRIKAHVFAKTIKIYGENSPEHEACKCRFGPVNVYGVSSKKALRAKINGDSKMLAESFFPAFEDALKRLITD